MALTSQQLKELDIASQRQLQGQASPTDVANLAYAKTKGYTYTPKTITADSLQPTEQVNVGTPTPDLSTQNATFASGEATTKNAQSTIDRITAERNQEVNQIDRLTKSVNEVLGNTVPEEQIRADEEAKRGTEQMQATLDAANADLGNLLAEYKQLQTQYEATSTENRNKPIGMQFIVGNEAQIQFAKASALNQKASEIGIQQAMVSAAQGRLDKAQEQIDKAVALKYGWMKHELDVKKTQLELMYDSFNAKEKLRADELNRIYDEQNAQIETEAQTEKDRMNFAIDAMNKYRDAGININDDYETVQTKIQSSPTFKTEQAQEQASLSRTNQLLNKAPSNTQSFTPTEKKKLEQAGLIDAPRQKQLDYLYGKESTNNAQFYIDRIKEGSVDYLNTDGTINWPAVPAALRQEVFDALEAEETTEQSKVGVMDVIKELPGAVKEIGKKVGGYIKNFFNLF